MCDEELRRAGPPPLSAERHAALRAQLMAEVEAEQTTLPGHTGRMRRAPSWRRRVGVAVIAAVGIVGSVSAAAVAGWLSPDPAETGIVIENAADQVAQHHPGWRPPLSAERVQCATTGTEEPPAFDAFAADFPLGNTITPNDFIRACTSKADTMEIGDQRDGITLCARPAGSLPEVQVVLDGTTCDRGFAVLTEADMERINGARRMEVALLAFPEPCPTFDEAEAWIDSKITELEMPLKLTRPATVPSTTPDTATDTGSDGACYRGWVSWVASTVTVDAYQLPN